MSSEYSRVVPQVMPMKVYGFKKVTRSELNNIINRLRKPTQSTETQLHSGELWQMSHVPPRAPFAFCGRTPTDFQCEPVAGSKPKISRTPVNGRTLQKIVRRLQRPTISTMAADGSIAPNYELQIPNKISTKRPKTADDQEKLMERIQRPTTASRRKLYGHKECILCEDLHCSSVYDSVKCIQEVHRSYSSHDDVDGALRRVRTPKYSGGGNLRCPKLAKHQSPSRSQSGQGSTKEDTLAPLISGLARSPKVQDITERLYRGPSSRSPVALI